MASILFVAYHFAPENVSGTHRSLHFARALVDAGHEVSVLAGPEPSADRSDAGLLRVFPFSEHVHRVQTPFSLGSLYMMLKPRRPARSVATAERSTSGDAEPADLLSRGLLARVRRNVSLWDVLPDPYRPWIRAAVRAGKSLGARIDADVVIASGPPWTGVMVGHRIARALDVPFIADFRDPWSSGTGATWPFPAEWAQRRVEQWEATVLADSAVVCFNSPRVAATAGALAPLGDRIHVILNGSDVPRQSESRPVPNGEPLRIRHIGSLYHGRNVTPLVRALDELIAGGQLSAEEVVLELIGDVEPSASRASMGDTRVRIDFSPHLKFTEVARLMSQPSVLVCVQTERYANQIPTKLFDYLCTGNPILVLAPEASAGWDLAREFARCHLLDLEATERNRNVLGSLIAAWRRGELRQQSALADTRHLGKAPLGEDFVRVVEDVIARAGSVNSARAASLKQNYSPLGATGEVRLRSQQTTTRS